jgi:nitrate/nitrite transport system permease protein
MSLTREDLLECLRTELDLDEPVEDETLLFSSALLDSFSMVTLVAFVEKRAGLRFTPGDVNLGNLDSIGRVLLGFGLAALVAIPLGFVIGMSPLLYRAFDPFIQVLKPISPLAWMPLALFTIKDSATSSIFVIFICSLWPMLINTAFGVSAVRREWLNVARTLEVSPMRKAFQVVLPAAAPTIMTGMRNSVGIAWLVIVAAEMLVGGTGIGYFVWNEWNNLSITNVINAILLIGIMGMVLDQIVARMQKFVSYAE